MADVEPAAGQSARHSTAHGTADGGEHGTANGSDHGTAGTVRLELTVWEQLL